MKSRILCTVLAFAPLVSIAVAQDHPALRWAEGAPNATSEVRNDSKVEGLKSDDIHIFASMSEIKETQYNRVWVQVSNHSKTPIDFDPQTAILINTEKDKTVRAEVPDKAAHSIQVFGEAKSDELSSAHCTMMNQTNCQPTNTQMQVSKQVKAFSSAQAQWLRDNGLIRKTLAPGEEIQGAIPFRKDKKAANYIFRVQVGNQVFEFPLTADNRAPSYN